jgi:thiamine pyrophosphate-dependent acetolactate synthase large subunit-like protein
MKRVEFIEELGKLRKDAAMIIGPGGTNSLIGSMADNPLTIYSMDMPYATPMALGVALGWPEKKVVSVEGDGSMLAGIGVLATIGRYKPKNFTVVVLDNSRYLATGTGLSPTSTAFGADIEQIGRAACVEQTCTVSEIIDARRALTRAFEGPGPWLIVAKVDESDYATPRYRPITVFESGLRFWRAAVSEREGGHT